MEHLYIVMSSSSTLNMLAVLQNLNELGFFQAQDNMAEVEERLQRERLLSQLDVNLRKWGFCFCLSLVMFVWTSKRTF